MMGPGKGYEYVIEALPEVVRKFPDLLYILVGETHPIVRKNEGEKYRNFLESKVKELKLQKHVKFYNKYVPLSEIVQYLKASDLYISSSDNPNQITSGTLSYAMGCGRAIISTPFLHAKDIVTESRGRLVNFRDPETFKDAIMELLSNESLRKEIEKNAYHYTRQMTWPNVALAYGKIFKQILGEGGIYIRELPRISIKHLVKMTDEFGIVQFANQATPDINSGYSLDDNARALIICAAYYDKFREYKQLKMISKYLDYIKYVRGDDGRLYNFVDKYRIVDKTQWSEDAHGRALWALGYLSSLKNIPKDFKSKAENLFLDALPATSIMGSPRAIAFVVAGLHFYNKERKSADIVKNIRQLADILVLNYRINSHEKWEWFEPYLTYSNSKLPEALFYAYEETGEQAYLEIAKRSLDFLITNTFHDGIFVPIGQRGWYKEQEGRALFDQQPIDAGYTVQTLITAHHITGDEKYKQNALDAFQWFLGKNMLKQVVYNEKTGGCHDGLGPSSINLNQGAESTISYLMARLCLMDI